MLYRIMKIWEKYLLDKRRDQLNKKAIAYKTKDIDTMRKAGIKVEVVKPRWNTHLIQSISKNEIDTMTIKDFE